MLLVLFSEVPDLIPLILSPPDLLDALPVDPPVEPLLFVEFEFEDPTLELVEAVEPVPVASVTRPPEEFIPPPMLEESLNPALLDAPLEDPPYPPLDPPLIPPLLPEDDEEPPLLPPLPEEDPPYPPLDPPLIPPPLLPEDDDEDPPLLPPLLIPPEEEEDPPELDPPIEEPP